MTITEQKYKWAYALTPRNVTTHLILHHSASSSATPEGIHAYHLSRGWAGIAYHYLVKKDGTIYRGRPENMRGAHTTDWNYCSIGICFEGNFETEQMPDAQIDAGRQLVADIVSRYPSIVVGMHKQFGQTSCPGKNFPFAEITTEKNECSDKSAEADAPCDDWAKDACDWAVSEGLFEGNDSGQLRWHDNLTRQQLAVILKRYSTTVSK